MSFAETATVLAQAHFESDGITPARTVKIINHSDKGKYYLRVDVDGSIVGMKGQNLTTEMAVEEHELVRLLTGKKKGFGGVKWTLTSNGEYSLLKPFGIERIPDGALVQMFQSIDISRHVYERIAQIALRQGSHSIDQYIETMLQKGLIGIECPNGVLTIHLDSETLDLCCEISEQTGTPIDSWIVSYLKENVPNFVKHTADGESEE